jgi:hypothetical protein
MVGESDFLPIDFDCVLEPSAIHFSTSRVSTVQLNLNPTCLCLLISFFADPVDAS